MKSSTIRHSASVDRGLLSLLPFVFLPLFLLSSDSLASASAPSGIIDTYVGGGDGDGAAAINAMIDPRGLIVVGADAYIVDGKNNRVRLVDGASGIITDVAGNGTRGFSGDGGQAQNAQLNLPLDVARDSAGNLYFSDFSNNRVRKVTPNGVISTFAGTGVLSYGGDGGLATQAALSNPWGITVGPDGYVYFADSGNNRIRKVGPPGCGPQSCIITTAVGNGTSGFGGDGGPAANAVLRGPGDVVFDAAGNMLIADTINNRVRMVTNGIINTVAGGGNLSGPGGIGDGGPAVQGVLRNPVQVVADGAGNIYITDTKQWRVRLVRDGIITTVVGTGNAGDGGDNGPAVNADIQLPYGIALGPAGDLWIATTTDVAISQHNRVRHVDTAGIITTVVGGGLADGAPAVDVLVDPHQAVATTGSGTLPDLYFADGSNNVVRFVDGRDSTTHVIAGNGQSGYSGDGGPATAARLWSPYGVAVDSGRNVYIADMLNHVVRRVSNGIITTVAGTGVLGSAGDGGPATRAQLYQPNGVCTDSIGNLYIADTGNNLIRKVDVTGVITTVAGNGAAAYGGDNGPATAASLRNPAAVIAAADGTLYIADTWNHRIRRVDQTGIITTYAGNGVGAFSGDGGPATLARIWAPAALSLDLLNNLYIADTNNYRVRVVDGVTHNIYTAAGTGGTGVNGDGGPATAATFDHPTGVAIDPSGGHLFISSSTDNDIRIVDFTGGSQLSTPTFTATPIPPTPTSPPNTATRTSIAPTPTNTAGATSVSISGRVTYYSNSQIAVPAADVAVSGGPAGQTTHSSTSTAGSYTASNLATGTWSVTPDKQGGFGNGVSSLDAARVLQAVAGLITFTPLQRIACDVTGDGTLSTLDAQRILQFSAGLINKLPVAQACGSDWAFYPSPGQAPNQQVVPPSISNGNCQPGNIVLNPLLGQVTNQDFQGILFGDCTGNWTPASAALRQVAPSSQALRQVAPSSQTSVRTGPPRRAPGHQLLIPIYVREHEPFTALDLQVSFDPSTLTLTSVVPRGSAADAMTGISAESPGTVVVSLANATPIDPSLGVMLVLEFHATGTVGSNPVQVVQAQVDEQATTVSAHSTH
jgi:sugar lactone lactonase YvrE